MYKSTGVNTDPEANKSCYKLRERETPYTKIGNIKELTNIYDFGEILGQGVFGTVMEVTDKSNKKTWAIKVVDKQQVEKHARSKIIDREIQILKLVNHPNIIYLDKIFESNQKIYLVLEKCNGELGKLLKQRQVFTEDEVRKIIQYLSSAVAYLHKHEIVHRDLKLENILTAVNPDDPSDTLYIKLTDFGLSIVKTGSRPEDMLNEQCGTLQYMAPEIISTSSYSHQCDVWAMGVLMYIMLVGRYPFDGKKEQDIVTMICSKEPSFTGFTVSPEAIHLLTKMLAKNPAVRITAAEVQHHAWLRGEPMTHDSPENVLDMMRLWRSEMMVDSRSESNWCNMEFKQDDSETIKPGYQELENIDLNLQCQERDVQQIKKNEQESPPAPAKVQFQQDRSVAKDGNRNLRSKTESSFRKESGPKPSASSPLTTRSTGKMSRLVWNQEKMTERKEVYNIHASRTDVDKNKRVAVNTRDFKKPTTNQRLYGLRKKDGKL